MFSSIRPTVNKLTKMIIYKAMLRGLPVVMVNEAYTSITCHVCGRRRMRSSQARFRCSACGEYNADLNGAINIARKVERHLGYMPCAGSLVNRPLAMQLHRNHQLQSMVVHSFPITFGIRVGTLLSGKNGVPKDLHNVIA